MIERITEPVTCSLYLCRCEVQAVIFKLFNESDVKPVVALFQRVFSDAEIFKKA